MKTISPDIKNALLTSPAGKQWQRIGVSNHHGIVVPLFSLHSKNSCGIGEYPDLIPLIHWCHEVGFDIIQLLPINDTGLETSPYSSLSANALNPIHIGLSSLPYLQHSALKADLVELQALTLQDQRLNYKVIQQKRDEFLRNYYNACGPTIKAQDNYQAFKKEHAYWLQDYAVFKALKIAQNWKNIDEWPAEYQSPNEAFFEHLPQNIRNEAEYHLFLQYLCFTQFAKVKRIAEDEHILLKGDIPILINRESADTWRHPHQFLMQFSAGAPPDMYAQEGQKWGFPPYDWNALASDNYRWWIERLRVASQLYHVYRIDHIVGFFRIWSIPIKLEAKNGYFLPEDSSLWIPQGEKIMRVMLNHSPMLPIGEDLGTVPTEVRENLCSLGICGTKVMRWERYWHGDQSFIKPEDYPCESMTTVSTHDSEPLKLWWRDQPQEAEEYAKSVGWEYYPELTPSKQFAILLASHRSGSLFHINLLQEYLALIPGLTWPNIEDERINVPATISDKNWSYRFVPSVEEIVANDELKKTIKILTNNN